MTEASILDLAGLGYTQLPRNRSMRRHLPLAAVSAAIVLFLAALTMASTFDGTRSTPRIGHAVAIGAKAEAYRAVSAMSADDKSQLIAEGSDAELRNAAIPVSSLPVQATGAFKLASNVASYPTALKCLTQAVYYEAASEPLEGQRAVAQVVLNRLRHPAYPKSVCGVVYEGSEKRSGCQFSFTCDGALLRGPMPSAWRRAEGVARAALAGAVDASVGSATHYHADYVLPKWAFQLGKIEQIGRHIFYRFNGRWGNAVAFNGRYSAVERIPAIDYASLEQRLLANPAAPFPDLAPGLTVPREITDRHADNDVGGRLDVTKAWRLTIPDPVSASGGYRASIDSEPADTPALIELARAPRAEETVQ